MVNEHRLQIIEILKSGDFVSGEDMAEKLGISRVAVWKHINRLEESGYAIETSRSGYRMTDETETPVPEAFGEDGSLINYLKTTGSTMTEARDAVFAGCPDGTVFTADTQTAGRGRRNRNWLSDEGGLYFTLVTRPDFSPLSAYSATVNAAACLCSILNDDFSLPARFKWPNDIYIGKRKAAGILEEFFVQGDKLLFVNLGIGINVHNNPHLKSATSLDSAGKRTFSRKNILELFLEKYKKTKAEDKLKLINKFSLLKNRQINSKSLRRGKVFGKAGEITADGGLIITSPLGKRIHLEFGDEIKFDF